MKKIEIAIYGAGGFAREVAWLAESCCTESQIYEVRCFIEDDPRHHGQKLDDIQILDLETARAQFPQARLVAAVGSPRLRQRLIEKAEAVGFDFETIVHPRVERSKRVSIGRGTIICAGNILTTNITIGEHVLMNLNCTIGHDCIVGNFTTLTPGIHVSGCVHIGERVFIGTGAVINNGTHDNPLVIGDGAVIGSAACVTKSVPAGLTVVGVPAKPLGHVTKEVRSN
jgi:sugar O-acyltransferase (sialic acid O-acetyltransferase NeuD family)